MDRPFNKFTDCAKCLREIDEITVRLKKLTIGPDTYRRYDEDFIKAAKYEKICVSCWEGKPAGGVKNEGI